MLTTLLRCDSEASENCWKSVVQDNESSATESIEANFIEPAKKRLLEDKTEA